MELKFTIHTVPALDTGFGRAAGYANDAELVEAAAAQRAALDSTIRELLDELDRRMEQWYLWGEEV